MPDHANKGRPKQPAKGKGAKNGRQGRGKATQTAKPPAPRLWLMLIAVLAISAGFGYFLFYIDGSAETAPTTTQQVTKKPAQAKPLPKAPTKSWDYEKLDQKEIEIELPEQEKNTRPYRLQCGSFKTMSQADTMKAKIAFQGYESYIKKVQGKTSPWYQVYLGPFERKRGAEAARHKLQRAGLNYCQIFLWQG